MTNKPDTVGGAEAKLWSKHEDVDGIAMARECFRQILNDYRDKSNPDSIERLVECGLAALSTPARMGEEEVIELMCRAYLPKSMPNEYHTNNGWDNIPETDCITLSKTSKYLVREDMRKIYHALLTTSFTPSPMTDATLSTCEYSNNGTINFIPRSDGVLQRIAATKNAVVIQIFDELRHDDGSYKTVTHIECLDMDKKKALLDIAHEATRALRQAEGK